MTNLEKYGEELCKYVDTNEGNLQDLITDFMDGQDVDFSNYCGTDNMIALWWLLEEYKESILDEKERKYLSAVIKPFKVRWIIKHITKNECEEYVEIVFEDIHSDILFPNFKTGTMYKGMEAEKRYTPKELGL